MRESQFYSFSQFISIKQYSEKRSNSAALLNKQKIMSEYFGWFAHRGRYYMLKHTLSFLTRCAWHRDTKIISACKIVANGWHLEIWGPPTDSRRQGIKSETVDIGENFHLATGRADRFISLSLGGKKRRNQTGSYIGREEWDKKSEVRSSSFLFSRTFIARQSVPRQSSIKRSKINERERERERDPHDHHRNGPIDPWHSSQTLSGTSFSFEAQHLESRR